MSPVEAVVLGLVQGLTEFIPISSSGHLVLVPWYLHWAKPNLVFDTTLHLGTLVALLVYFWRDVWEIALAWLRGWQGLKWKEPAARMGWLLIVGTIPAVVLGVAFEDQFEAMFGDPGPVGAQIAFTGVLLVASEWLGGRANGTERIDSFKAVVIGFAQALAIVPGISRSGATIAAGLALGITRTAAARYSFLLSIPVIAGAGVKQLLDVAEGTEASPGTAMLLVGFAVSAISGYLCIRFLLGYLQRNSLNVFTIYCFAFGLITMGIWIATGGQGIG